MKLKLKLQAGMRQDGDFSLCVYQERHVQHTDFACKIYGQ
jgi:hypothetical protein